MTYTPLPRPNRQRIASSVMPQANNSLDVKELFKNEKPPMNWKKPDFNTLEYQKFRLVGWISKKEEKYDYLNYCQIKLRGINNSLKINLSDIEFWEKESPKDTNEFIPEISALIYKDRRLTNSAIRVFLHIFAERHKRNRKGGLETTKSYIAKACKISPKTAYNALDRLENCGYIERLIVKGERTRMTKGLFILFSQLCFPKHQQIRRRGETAVKQKFQTKPMKTVEIQGRQILTHKYKYNNLFKGKCYFLTVSEWNRRISDGLIRSKERIVREIELQKDNLQLSF